MKGPVLIIDDEMLVREALTDILETVGIDVLLAKNVQEGINLYRHHAHEIELVILDIRLPEMNGAHMLHYLRHMNPRLRAIVASGYDTSHIHQQFSHDPNVHILQKPFGMEGFLQAVKQALAY
jgi:two-component system, cell cycle sensor histidine kinase and response regulator CckA